MTIDTDDLARYEDLQPLSSSGSYHRTSFYVLQVTTTTGDLALSIKMLYPTGAGCLNVLPLTLDQLH